MSSAGALLGLAGVATGLRWADAVAGLLVTAFIAHVGWEVTGDLLEHLMDGVEPGILASAVSATETVPSVSHAHARARWTGRSLVIEVEGYLNPRTALIDAQLLSGQVEAAVARAVPEATAVLWSARPASPDPAEG
jgi:divalent metal cation (Fe/Co/Zn/Cd) transporter